jgi:hypothetical protein
MDEKQGLRQSIFWIGPIGGIDGILACSKRFGSATRRKEE